METLSQITVNLTNGSFSFSDFAQWLTEPQIITGALLISTGDCWLVDDLINFTVSLQADLNDSLKGICECTQHCQLKLLYFNKCTSCCALSIWYLCHLHPLPYNPTMCLHTTVPLQSSSDSETALQELLESHSHTLAEFFAQVLQIETGSTEKDTSNSLSLLELVLVIAGGVGLGLLCGCCVCVAAILVCRRWRRHRK